MKKISALLIAMVSLPVLALCPIDNNAVCSLTDSDNNLVAPFNTNNNSIRSFQHTESQLSPLNQENPMTQMRNPNNNLNYDSGCMLGNCKQSQRDFIMQNKRDK